MGICHDLNVDLHTHSSASDGVLSPENLVKRAANNKVDILALTDHDSVAGISEALEVSRSTDLHFIPGVEISVSWGGACIHLVGLDVDHENTEFLGALLGIQTGRLERAKRIDESLQKEGLPSLLTAALDFSKNLFTIKTFWSAIISGIFSFPCSSITPTLSPSPSKPNPISASFSLTALAIS